MNFAINESYNAYVYLALLQCSLFFLQRMNYVRQRSVHRGESTTANVLIDFYCTLTAFIATVLNWGALALAAWVGYSWGIPAGLLFFVIAFFASNLAMFIPSGFFFDLAGHIVSIFATPYLLQSLWWNLSLGGMYPSRSLLLILGQVAVIAIFSLVVGGVAFRLQRSTGSRAKAIFGGVLFGTIFSIILVFASVYAADAWETDFVGAVSSFAGLALILSFVFTSSRSRSE